MDKVKIKRISKDEDGRLVIETEKPKPVKRPKRKHKNKAVYTRCG